MSRRSSRGLSAQRGYRTVDVDGFEVLVGRGARDNDHLTLKVAEPDDLWLHAAGYAGSHVVVRNPDSLPELPRHVVEQAAVLAAWHSKARGAGGKVEIHVCRAGDVKKPRGYPPGMVVLKRWESLKVYARQPALSDPATQDD
jgi:predicted ribosome quality control (RQC) complex YloA/Tae2 family protein